MWWCFPRFDSDPVFSRLLAGDEEKGFCDVALAGLVETKSRYMRNTAIVETILTDAHGGKVRVTDFAPRFDRFEREFRPPQIIRRIEPIAGLPRIAIRVRPTHNYGRPTTNVVVGSNHIRYVGGAQVMRLTTDAPLSYIVNEITFPLTRPVNLIFGQDDPFLSAIDTTSREFLDRTRDHWLDWVRNLAVPFEWQAAVVRAAITLKLCSFQETGAIVAAHTTSHPGSAVVVAKLGLSLLLAPGRLFRRRRAQPARRDADRWNPTSTTSPPSRPTSRTIQPVHGIVPFSSLEETIAPDLKGFLGHGPVRVGNQAAQQTQNDVYGSVVLAATQMFVDERLPKMGDEALFRLLEALGERALALRVRTRRRALGISHPRARPHLFRDAVLGGLRPARPDRRGGSTSPTAPSIGRTHARAMRERILSEALGRKARRADRRVRLARSRRQRLAGRRARPPAGDRRPRSSRPATRSAASSCATGGSCAIPRPTISARRRPRSSPATSGTWTRSVRSGATAEARELFESILAHRNAYGLLSEDIHPDTGELWGNLPQTYSMAGIINTATRLSSSWEEAWARDSS